MKQKLDIMRPAPQQKERRCMMCQRMFASSWVGERICRRCRASKLWKQGG